MDVRALEVHLGRAVEFQVRWYVTGDRDGMAQLKVRGASLDFTDEGRGESLVLVHGSVSDRRTWALQRTEFAKRFRTVTYSRRYHWPNAQIPPGRDYSMLEQLADLGALLETIDAHPAHLVGHSYGAYLALLLTTRNPEKVRSLVLAEPPVLPLLVSIPPKPRELVRLFFTRPHTAITVVRFGARGLGRAKAAFERGDPEEGLRLSGTAVLGREAFASLSQERLEQARANLIEAEYLGSGFAPLRDEDVRAVPHPTLLLGSEKSPVIFSILLDRLQELLPNATRARIPGAAHIMHEDNPAAFNRAVLDFLEAGAEG